MSTRFKPKYNIKKGDTVVVIAGDDKDLKKPRQVLQVIVDKGRVVVEGASIITKHTKPSAQNTKGGIVKKEAATLCCGMQKQVRQPKLSVQERMAN
jgi:large subunit ribosomal protein L24